jgi:hypothetical protein
MKEKEEDDALPQHIRTRVSESQPRVVDDTTFLALGT